MRRPPISQKVIEGIITATSFILAGDTEETFKSSKTPDRDEDEVIAADQWARGMREWMRSRETWKETR
jgi:hypothetical protein